MIFLFTPDKLSWIWYTEIKINKEIDMNTNKNLENETVKQDAEEFVENVVKDGAYTPDLGAFKNYTEWRHVNPTGTYADWKRLRLDNMRKANKKIGAGKEPAQSLYDQHQYLKTVRHFIPQILGERAKNSHGGTRKGAGRKSSQFPVFSKKLRATDLEREEFLSYLTGDARKDFEALINALAFWRKAAGLPVRRLECHSK